VSRKLSKGLMSRKKNESLVVIASTTSVFSAALVLLRTLATGTSRLSAR
jgi:hypothetical protein